MSDREMNAIAELKDGLKSMIREKRLTATMLPNDFEWLLKAIKELDEATAEANGEPVEKSVEAQKVCPKCGSKKVEMFHHDMDWCKECKHQWFV